MIISAEGEWRTVPKVYPDAEYKNHPYGQYIKVTLNSEPVIIMHGGWAKVQSAASTQYAIDRWGPELIVNLGTCGGFRGHIERDEIVMPNRAVIYDIISEIGDPDEHFRFFTTDIDTSCIKPPYPHPVETCTIVSGDRDLQPEAVPQLYEKFGAKVGDWESAAIAFVCRRNNTRLLILRGVSDLVGPDGGEAYDGTKVKWLEAADRIMRRLLSSLPDWLARYQE
ncbi:MAG: 5'-methylthioadenosine/S-adenosylhomocysteine nucleosidase [Armatimonadetes bacterium]|nr:5'-methylthioadenosine/S-adenosylhomocysteine nucleosidase [Armatimonadota bacterium]